ncbi:VWA domain-containing protein [Micromonospora tulbaghiae]|uniref:vWA domain-containing protein n=1 Tax=Micromonospora tulbaghiae TaxID=479978 RepID=UPI0033D6DBD6
MSERATEGQVVMPFYIVCDVSGSMCGDMADLNAGVTGLRQEIMKDPVADDLAMLSVIAFDDTARTVMPLNFPSAMELQTLSCGGLTNYTAAFQEFHRAFEADRVRLKSEGKRVFRPCIFFLTDGEPTSRDHLQVFQQLLGYDPVTKQGNPRYPYVTPFGFRGATEESMKALAYPNFGEKKGRYFLAKQGASVPSLLKAISGMIGTSVLSSSLSGTVGTFQYTPPATDASPELEGSFVD